MKTNRVIVTAEDIDIEALRQEAGEAGDTAMVAICDRAMDGDLDAINACVEAVQAARDAD